MGSSESRTVPDNTPPSNMKAAVISPIEQLDLISRNVDETLLPRIKNLVAEAAVINTRAVAEKFLASTDYERKELVFLLEKAEDSVDCVESGGDEAIRLKRKGVGDHIRKYTALVQQTTQQLMAI